MSRLPSWNSLLTALVLVRTGQELGSNSPLSGAVHSIVTIILNVFK